MPKLTMVNVWAAYCNPCLNEMPGLGKLAAEYDAEQFPIISIISDVLKGEDHALAETLVRQMQADYTHLFFDRLTGRVIARYFCTLILGEDPLVLSAG